MLEHESVFKPPREGLSPPGQQKVVGSRAIKLEHVTQGHRDEQELCDSLGRRLRLQSWVGLEENT
jgi:hypothetical protein